MHQHSIWKLFIMDIMSLNVCQNNLKEWHIQVKMNVGMSRARYLLCVAIQKDRFDNMDCAELREIWDIVDA